MTTLDPRPDSLPKRVAESIQRDPLPPADDRGRMRVVMNNLILHIHPASVARPALRFTYTWGLGGLALLLGSILALTGVMLLFVYTPSPVQAYNDMLALQTDVWFGQFIRNLHHWSGNFLVVVTFLHLLRIFFTGGFAAPREFNWVLGVSLLLLVVGANFTGYLLPWDQLAYWAVTVGTSLLAYIPVVGDWMGRLILGGPEVGAATLVNFYSLHIAVIPMLAMVVISFHLWRVRKDKLTIPRNLDGEIIDLDGEILKKVTRVTTLPHLVSRELVFAIMMTGLILLWALLVDAPLEGAANPDLSPNPAKAAWYFMGLQELLMHFHPIFGAVILPGLALVALVAVPYLRFDMKSEGIWFRSRKGRWMAALSVYFGFAATTILVLVDELFLDLPALLPSLPTIISNGLVPLAALLLMLIGYYELMKMSFKATACEVRLSVFVLLLTAFIILTIIGVFFRGQGMALVWPGEVLR